jgi:outer membrane protease
MKPVFYSGLLLDFSAGFSFPLQYGFLFKTFAVVSYKHFSFFGMGGYLKYARQTGDHIFVSIDDKLEITNRFIFVPGISLRYYIVKQFFAEISFQISPLILCADVDEHLKRNVEFRDYPWGGLFLEPGLQFSYVPGERLDISLGGSWQKIGGSRGPTYYREPIGQGEYIMAGEAGTSLSLLDISLRLKIRI